MANKKINTSKSLKGAAKPTIADGADVKQIDQSEADAAQAAAPTDGKKPVKVTPNEAGDVDTSGAVHGHNGAPAELSAAEKKAQKAGKHFARIKSIGFEPISGTEDSNMVITYTGLSGTDETKVRKFIGPVDATHVASVINGVNDW